MNSHHTANLEPDPDELWRRLESLMPRAGMAAILGLFACIAGSLADSAVLTAVGLGVHLAAVLYIAVAGLMLLDRQRRQRR